MDIRKTRKSPPASKHATARTAPLSGKPREMAAQETAAVDEVTPSLSDRLQQELGEAGDEPATEAHYRHQPHGSKSRKFKPGHKPPKVRSHKPRKRRLWLRILLPILGIIIVAAIGAGVWVYWALGPVDSKSTAVKQLVIEPGSSPRFIAGQLEKEGLIKQRQVFLLYAKFTGAQDHLKAGQHELKASMGAEEILKTLQKQPAPKTVTFFPGATLRPTHKTKEKPESRLDVQRSLQKAGYSDEQIEHAFTAEYNHPVLAGRPAGADLEGYVFGDTYQHSSSASAKDTITLALDELQDKVKKNDIEAKLKARGMTLYQGITMASIVQKEVTGYEDMRKVAQVFYTRLQRGIPLGADSTYQYIADKKGIARDYNLDSPYNTRKVKGLPPGPISAPSLDALKAVANPAPTDYLYFINGDDDKNYFSKTNEEHEKLVKEKCATKCSWL